MLSVLIPTYNYNAFPLVEEIQQQCTKLQIEFEILVYNDGGKLFLDENAKINAFKNCQFINNLENIGRTQSRNFLAQKSKYNWLLFLDSDVLPTSSNFIKNYLDFLNNSFSVYIGGIQYQNILIEDSKILRYKYGKKREESNSETRKKNPYNAFFSCNLLIKKEVFEQYNFDKPDNLYGLDIYFAYQLFINKIEIVHIDNPVFHIGIEENEVFFIKSIQAVKTRKKHLSKLKDIEKINTLLKHYLTLKKYKLDRVLYTFFKISEPILKKLIYNKNPILWCLDLYRLGVICNPKE